MALLALLEYFRDGWSLQEILHLTLVVEVPLVVSALIVVLYCSLSEEEVQCSSRGARGWSHG